jgi:peptidoglycan/LPS O-acetylase OafA/YrhL
LDGIRGLAAILVLVFHVLAAGNMLVSAFALGVLTLLLPVPLTWCAIAYAAVGFAFSAAYAVSLTSKKRP